MIIRKYFLKFLIFCLRSEMSPQFILSTPRNNNNIPYITIIGVKPSNILGIFHSSNKEKQMNENSIDKDDTKKKKYLIE